MSDTTLTEPRTTEPRTTAIRARHAASLIVLRPGPAMLMGMRGKGHRFMPNRLVFPGGSVDRADATAPVASPAPPHVLALLQKSCKPGLAHALTVAAARELEEETGLTLGSPPALARFDYLGRAITPPTLPIRFNARFFVVDEAAVSGTLAGSGELEDLRWFGIEEAMALDLARPTRAVIELLQDWLKLTTAAREARLQTPVMRQRKWTME